jgi:NADH-quinone oxidoreductase subunit L
MFHLMTHAFFKALLFLGAGIVIHALSGEQDIRRMGGLGRAMPWTYRAFIVGALSLAAIPPFSGFFSKDAILASAIDAGALGVALWAVGVVGAFLTALYTFRVVFSGPSDPFVKEHLHVGRFEGSPAMMWPVGILAVLSVVGGWIQVPGGWALVDDWLEPVVPSIPEASGWLLAVSVVVSLAAALLGIGAAWKLYGRRSPTPERLRGRYPRATRALEKKFYFDEAYDLAFSEPTSRFAVALDRDVEKPIVLGSLRGLATGVGDLARTVASAQSGLLRSYALVIAASLAVIVLVFVSVR